MVRERDEGTHSEPSEDGGRPLLILPMLLILVMLLLLFFFCTWGYLGENLSKQGKEAGVTWPSRVGSGEQQPEGKELSDPLLERRERSLDGLQGGSLLIISLKREHSLLRSF